VASDPIPVAPALAHELDQLGLAFLTEILEAELARHPNNIEALTELGHAYTRQGLIESGLAIDRRLALLAPDDPNVHYNLACSLALSGERELALRSLSDAVDRGYDDPEFMSQDEDLASLRHDERFQALVRRLRERAIGGQIPPP
jgi:Flp pilus assembly protein TadD